MVLRDFTYDGIALSEMSGTLCVFDRAYEAESDIGNHLDIQQVRPPRSYQSRIIATPYLENMSKSFSICKDTCTDLETTVYTEEEIDEMMRWLNRKEYLEFRPIFDDASFEDSHYNATFDVRPVLGQGGVIGFNLKMTTDSPFAYRDRYTKTKKENQSVLSFDDISDEIGFLYGDLTITCKEAGGIRIVNDASPNDPITIDNCVSGETITLLGKTKIIQTDNANHSHTLHDDFNFEFLKIANTYENRKNTIHVYKMHQTPLSDFSCELTVSYDPVRKAGLV